MRERRQPTPKELLRPQDMLSAIHAATRAIEDLPPLPLSSTNIDWEHSRRVDFSRTIQDNLLPVLVDGRLEALHAIKIPIGEIQRVYGTSEETFAASVASVLTDQESQFRVQYSKSDPFGINTIYDISESTIPGLFVQTITSGSIVLTRELIGKNHIPQ